MTLGNIKELDVKDFKLEIKIINKDREKFFDIYPKLNNKTPKEIFGDIALFCFSPFEFHKSLEALKNQKEGRYFLFTCKCGNARCDSWHRGVLVYSQDNNLFWIVDEKVKNPIKLKFNIRQYKQVHDELITRLNELYNQEGEVKFNRGDKTSLKSMLNFFKTGKYYTITCSTQPTT